LRSISPLFSVLTKNVFVHIIGTSEQGIKICFRSLGCCALSAETVLAPRRWFSRSPCWISRRNRCGSGRI
jgi:hypothetical protein